MSRVFQDIGTIDFVNNKTVECLLCVSWRNETTQEISPYVFWLKTCEEDHWNRFFLDAGLAFWEVCSELGDDDFDDPDADPVTDLGKDFGLIGTQILSIFAYDKKSEKGELAVALRITFSSGHELLFYNDEEYSNFHIQKG